VSQVIKRPVAFADDCVGDVAVRAVAAMKDGDVLCLENTRFHPQEEKNDKAFVDQLAKLGDIWVNDAFSAAHRAHASTEGLGHKLPAYAGRTMQAELDALGKALEAPTRPVIAIIGGAKVSTKIDLLENLVGKVDALVIGGGMANTFLHAQGVGIGKSLAEKDLAATALRIVDTYEPPPLSWPALARLGVAVVRACGIVALPPPPATELRLRGERHTIARACRVRDRAEGAFGDDFRAWLDVPHTASEVANRFHSYAERLPIWRG